MWAHLKQICMQGKQDMKLMCFQCSPSRGTWCRKEQLKYHVTAAFPHLKKSFQFWISMFNKTVNCDKGKGKTQLEKPSGLNILVWSCLACVSKCVWGQWSHFNIILNWWQQAPPAHTAPSTITKIQRCFICFLQLVKWSELLHLLWDQSLWCWCDHVPNLWNVLNV